MVSGMMVSKYDGFNDFREIIVHFKLNGVAIYNTVEEWEASQKSSCIDTRLLRLWDNLKRAYETSGFSEGGLDIQIILMDSYLKSLSETDR